MELWLLLSPDSGMRDDLVEHAQADDNIVDFAIQYPAGAAGFSVHRRYR